MTQPKFTRAELGALAAILLIAAIFRYWQINEYPRALHFDEAINGLVTHDLLRGQLPQLLTYDRAREPIIFYVMALPVYFLGPTPGALRIATASVSLALVAGVFLLARELFGRKIGLLTALVCAITVWPIYHGRLATRSILVPVFLTVALCFAVRAWRTNRLRHWTICGVVFGAVFYTYANNLFVIPALALTALGALIYDRAGVVERKWGLLLAGALIVAIATPITVFRLTHPSSGPGRPGFLLVFYAGQSAVDFIKTFLTQSVLIGRMFFIKGDLVNRHNIPGRPVFDPLMALPFVVGLAALIKRKPRPALALCGLWLLVWLAPTFVAKDAPHFLRGSGALATIFIWPALGLDRLSAVIRQRVGRVAAPLVVGALVGGSFLITTHDYILSNFLASPELFESFNGSEIGPILELNRQLNTGWMGDNVRALPAPAHPPTLDELGLPEPLPQPYAQYLIPWLFDSSSKQY